VREGHKSNILLLYVPVYITPSVFSTFLKKKVVDVIILSIICNNIILFICVLNLIFYILKQVNSIN